MAKVPINFEQQPPGCQSNIGLSGFSNKRRASANSTSTIMQVDIALVGDLAGSLSLV